MGRIAWCVVRGAWSVAVMLAGNAWGQSTNLSTNLYSVKLSGWVTTTNPETAKSALHVTNLSSAVLGEYIKAGTNITIEDTGVLTISATCSGTNAPAAGCDGSTYISHVSPNTLLDNMVNSNGIYLIVNGCGFINSGYLTVGENPAHLGLSTIGGTNTTIYGLWEGGLAPGVWNLHYWETNELKATLTNAITVVASAAGVLNLVQTNNNVFTGVNTFSNLNGSGANLTELNATALASGTVSNTRLSGVALLAGTNTFTGTNTFSGPVQITGTLTNTGDVKVNGALVASGTLSMGAGAISIGGQSSIGGVSGTTYLYGGGATAVSVASGGLVKIYNSLTVTNGLYAGAVTNKMNGIDGYPTGTTNIAPVNTPLGLFGYAGFQGSQAIDVVSDGVYVNVVSNGVAFNRVLTNGFTYSATGFLTNTVAGYYGVTIGATGAGSVGVQSKEYELELFVNGIAEEYLSSSTTGSGAGTFFRFNTSGIFYLAANSSLELRIKEVGTSNNDPTLTRFFMKIGAP